MAFSILEQMHFAPAYYPAADPYAGGTESDVMNMERFNKCAFLLMKGVGATGVITVTVNACDDVVPTNQTAIPFRYRYGTATDVPGTLTEATSTGFALTAGSNELVLIEVDAVEIRKAGATFEYVQLAVAEGTDGAILSSVLWAGYEARYSTVDAGDTVLT